MAKLTKRKQQRSKPAESIKPSPDADKTDMTKAAPSTGKELAAEHLPPLALVAVIMACSGMMMVFAFRDVFSTGKIVGGAWDAELQSFTKSMDWFDDSKGWKSQQGGLSAVRQVTTDANNMGGFFVRKLGGAMAMVVHGQKLVPMLFHPSLDARWKNGHFAPMLWTAAVGNLALVAFYASYLPDLVAAGADSLPKLMMLVLVLEAAVMSYFAWTTGSKKGPSIAMTDGKTPKSVPSRIVTRTVSIVSTLMALVAGRDLIKPGHIFDFFPRDDIYLEWTNAFLHSPPDGTPEADSNGISSSLYVGDKFVSQFMALNLLICIMYKFVTAFGIRYGNDGRGLIQSRMIWKVQAMGDIFLLSIFRLFASAAMSASLDLRWHLMCIGYETLILILYGYF